MECSLRLDEALEALYAHFTWLVSNARRRFYTVISYFLLDPGIRVITTNDVALTYELHIIRAHLLHYNLSPEGFPYKCQVCSRYANPAMDANTLMTKHELQTRSYWAKNVESPIGDREAGGEQENAGRPSTERSESGEDISCSVCVCVITHKG